MTLSSLGSIKHLLFSGKEREKKKGGKGGGSMEFLFGSELSLIFPGSKKEKKGENSSHYLYLIPFNLVTTLP